MNKSKDITNKKQIQNKKIKIKTQKHHYVSWLKITNQNQKMLNF